MDSSPQSSKRYCSVDRSSVPTPVAKSSKTTVPEEDDIEKSPKQLKADVYEKVLLIHYYLIQNFTKKYLTLTFCW